MWIRWELITNYKTDLLNFFHRASKFCQRVWWCTWFETKCSRVVFIKCSCDTFSCFSITPFVSCTFDWSARRYEFTLIDYFRAKLVIFIFKSIILYALFSLIFRKEPNYCNLGSLNDFSITRYSSIFWIKGQESHIKCKLHRRNK